MKGGVVLCTALVYWNLLSLIDCWDRAEAVLEIYRPELKDQRWDSGVSCELIWWEVVPTRTPSSSLCRMENVLNRNPWFCCQHAVSSNQTRKLILEKWILAFQNNFISSYASSREKQEHRSPGKVCLAFIPALNSFKITWCFFPTADD